MEPALPDIGCRHFAKQVGDHVDGRLSGVARAACERHLLRCPDCRGLARRQRLLLRALAGTRDPAVPERLREALLAAFRRRHPGGTRNARRQR
jgi:predicted anti-sigma-YlaC factor YlaD